MTWTGTPTGLDAAALLGAALAGAESRMAPAEASADARDITSTHAAEPAPRTRPAEATGCARRGRLRVFRLRYSTHNRLRRNAYLIVPASYRRDQPPLPLVISPHGRGAHPSSQNVGFWRDLPARGRFAVINPDGSGRLSDESSWESSWGYGGQIEDLARMPQAIAEAYPWIRIDRNRVYAVGTSMGGQETLLLVARQPRVLAGAAAFDSVTDLALRYRQFPKTTCAQACLKRWGRHVGYVLQDRMRVEVGGTPAECPDAYAERSPLAFAHELASSGVPLQIWWSRADEVVTQQWTQSGRLARRIRSLNPRAPLTEHVGSWGHSSEMRGRALVRALEALGLLG